MFCSDAWHAQIFCVFLHPSKFFISIRCVKKIHSISSLVEFMRTSLLSYTILHRMFHTDTQTHILQVSTPRLQCSPARTRRRISADDEHQSRSRAGAWQRPEGKTVNYRAMSTCAEFSHKMLFLPVETNAFFKALHCIIELYLEVVYSGTQFADSASSVPNAGSACERIWFYPFKQVFYSGRTLLESFSSSWSHFTVGRHRTTRRTFM